MRVGVNLLWCRPGRSAGPRSTSAASSSASPIAARGVRPPARPAGLRCCPSGARHPLRDRHRQSVTRCRGARLLTEALTARRFRRRRRRPPRRWHAAGASRSARDRAHRPRRAVPPPPAVLLVARRAYLASGCPARCAATVIAVPSEFVGATLVDAFGIDAAKHRRRPPRLRPARARALSAADDLRRRYRLGDRRVLVYPAITHPHKGHRLLVELLAGPWSAGDLVLVLLGGAGAADDAVSAAIAALGVGDRIVRPGRVPAADRDGLVALAEALVFPSEYEGFGAPVLEAMALGAPVICSDRAALPRWWVTPAVVLPLTVEAWADALSIVAAEPPRARRAWPAASRTVHRPHPGTRPRRCLPSHRGGNADDASRRAVPALRSRHGADGTGDVADRGRARRSWPPRRRRHGAAVVPRAPHRACLAGERRAAPGSAWGSITRVNPLPR